MGEGVVAESATQLGFKNIGLLGRLNVLVRPHAFECPLVDGALRVRGSHRRAEVGSADHSPGARSRRPTGEDDVVRVEQDTRVGAGSSSAWPDLHHGRRGQVCRGGAERCSPGPRRAGQERGGATEAMRCLWTRKVHRPWRLLGDEGDQRRRGGSARGQRTASIRNGRSNAHLKYAFDDIARWWTSTLSSVDQGSGARDRAGTWGRRSTARRSRVSRRAGRRKDLGSR